MSGPALLARFEDAEALQAAARALRADGRRGMDAFTPHPVHGLARTLGMAPTRLPYAMLAGGIAGAVAAYGLVIWSVGIDYPINVGGRALNAWPAYLVLSFEGGILGAALTGFLGLLHANGLPRYHHPVFDAEGFGMARGGGFWLLVPEAGAALRARLEGLGAVEIAEVAG